MELQLVNFEQAKALKELGFPQNIYTSKVYLEKTIPHDIIAKECGLSDWQCIGGKLIPCSSDYNKYGVDTCNCPTLELVAKWLRDEKSIIVTVKPFFVHSNVHSKEIEVIKYIVNVEGITEGNTYFVQFTSAPINSYEESLSVGIDKAIEILKGI